MKPDLVEYREGIQRIALEIGTRENEALKAADKRDIIETGSDWDVEASSTGRHLDFP